ncbi:MAG: hypothetical protein RB191_22035 [Terriglobia bacterium]|nr:hypothetical protein [Terriglobia bacterium]
MRVKMLVDAPGSPDGVTVLDYTEGVVYDVPDDLGNVFLAEKFAAKTRESVTAEPEPEPEVEDAHEPEPETKLGAGPEENK